MKAPAQAGGVIGVVPIDTPVRTGCQHFCLRRDWKASPVCATIIPQAAGAAQNLPGKSRRSAGSNQGGIDDNPD
jgi:hypothetical protein